MKDRIFVLIRRWLINISEIFGIQIVCKMWLKIKIILKKQIIKIWNPFIIAVLYNKLHC